LKATLQFPQLEIMYKIFFSELSETTNENCLLKLKRLPFLWLRKGNICSRRETWAWRSGQLSRV